MDRHQKEQDNEAACERKKIQIEKGHELVKMQLESDLKNPDATATNAPVVPVAMCKKRKPVTSANVPMVSLEIYKKSNTTTPLTE
jgi:hypothetical protein